MSAHLVSRRRFLEPATVAMVAAGLGDARVTAAIADGRNGSRQDSQPPAVRALVFDTFGTVVDWRSSVAREAEVLAKRKGVTLDATKFADAWRAGYGPSMNRVRSGEVPWTKLDALHRMTLDKILGDFAFTCLSC